MPIYEYGCQKCGHEFEELVRGNATPNCPACGSKEVQKMMSKCCHHGGGGGESVADAAPSSGGGCHGCHGGNCSTCAH